MYVLKINVLIQHKTNIIRNLGLLMIFNFYHLVVTCGRPSAISHGSFSGNDFTYAGKIQYTCDKNYNMTDPAQLFAWIMDRQSTNVFM